MVCKLTDDKEKGYIRERLDLRGNHVDVFLVQGGAIIGKRQLAIGGQRSAIALRQIVNHKWQYQVRTCSILLLYVFGESRDNGNLGSNITD
jgi:hypothetical protein